MSNPSTTTGTLILDAVRNGPFAIALKAGDNYSAYFFDSSFMNVTGFQFNNQALVNGGGQVAGLSHASLYVGSITPNPPGPGPNVAPEPASSLICLLLGATGLVYRRWSKKVL